MFDRAMRYGVMGFLMAKDVLHLILPDSKKTERKPSASVNVVAHLLPEWGSLLLQWDRARRGGMSLVSLPDRDGKRGGALRSRSRSAPPLCTAAAGGVAAVLRTADSTAGR